MKECWYCDTIIEDGKIRCPKCNGTLFKNSTSTLPLDAEEMIRQALKKSRISFTDGEVRAYTKQIKAYCKENDLLITKDFLEKFLENLNK